MNIILCNMSMEFSRVESYIETIISAERAQIETIIVNERARTEKIISLMSTITHIRIKLSTLKQNVDNVRKTRWFCSYESNNDGDIDEIESVLDDVALDCINLKAHIIITDSQALLDEYETAIMIINDYKELVNNHKLLKLSHSQGPYY